MAAMAAMAVRATWRVKCPSRAQIACRGANPAGWDVNIDNLALAVPNIRAGKPKALAATTLQANPMLPGARTPCPTLSKALALTPGGVWWGLPAHPQPGPSGWQGLGQSLECARNQNPFAALMAEPVPAAPAQFDQRMASEQAQCETATQALGATAD